MQIGRVASTSCDRSAVDGRQFSALAMTHGGFAWRATVFGPSQSHRWWHCTHVALGATAAVPGRVSWFLVSEHRRLAVGRLAESCAGQGNRPPSGARAAQAALRHAPAPTCRRPATPPASPPAVQEVETGDLLPSRSGRAAGSCAQHAIRGIPAAPAVGCQAQSRRAWSCPPIALQELTISGTCQRHACGPELRRSRCDYSSPVGCAFRCCFRVRFCGSPPVYEGGGELFLTCDQDGGGYVCWIRGTPGANPSPALQLTAPVREVGNEVAAGSSNRRAPTSSELDLRVPIPDAVATVSDGLLTVKKEGGETRFLVNGIAGDFQLAWTKAAAPPVETRPALRAI